MYLEVDGVNTEYNFVVSDVEQVQKPGDQDPDSVLRGPR